VVGAGLAGLAAALSLAGAGWAVTIHEAAPAAGGRCRSYFDRELGCRIDNGNHLLLSGNRFAASYLEEIGARDTMTGPAHPCFPFLDLATGARWTVRPNAGPLPWWLMHPGRRVPGTGLRDLPALLALLRARAEATVAEVLPRGPLGRCLLEPLAIAALNTPPASASARLLAAVLRDSLARGGSACLPLVPRVGLSESFVDPALARLRGLGATLRLGHRITGLAVGDASVTALASAEGTTPLAAEDRVVLAVPPAAASVLLPGLIVPDAFEAILNLHFRLDAAPGEAGFVGLIGGTAEWVFVKPGIVSVTVSAASRLAEHPAEALVATIWPEVRAALCLPHGPPPPWRVVREKRATFAATPAQDARRPPARTHLRNLVLAGDWTATGLPATIEGAIKSGRGAADACLT
jgi:squalene-associated FAD-dependent desaturase